VKTKIISVIALLITQYTYALVDYSEVEGAAPTVKARPKAQVPTIKRNAPRAAKAANKGGPSSIELSTMFEQHSVNGETVTGDINKVSFAGHFQTQYNLYLDFSYWAASNDLNTFEGVSDYEKGRPEFILGFNWLRFGAVQEMATVDIYGGATFKGSKEIASTRTDKIVGVETSKRFHSLAIALGYEYVLAGTPSDSQELTIGDISTLKTSIGWMVSGDISFVLEGGMVSIGDATSSDSAYKLTEETKFSYLKPTAILGLSPFISLEMGGVFRTRTAKDIDTLVDAKLWNVPGAYGNSLFAGLKFSI
jgi:hypothetical protein